MYKSLTSISPRSPRCAIVATSVGAALAVLASCSGDGDATSDRADNINFSGQTTIENLSQNIVVQTYSDLNAAAQALLVAANNLARDGATEAEMSAAQDAWKAARVPWESSEGFLFGPVDSLGIDPALDSWPLNTPDLQNVLSTQQASVDFSDFVATAGEDLKGFHAMEFLLFGDGVADNEKTAAELTVTEAAYLAALAADMQSRTRQLEESWRVDFIGNGPYVNLVNSPGTDNTTYGSQSAVFEEYINGLVGIADEVANAKIAEPFGTSATAADTSLVESQYSWNSLMDFSNNLQSILNIYTGVAGFDRNLDTISATQNGIYGFVLAHDDGLANRLLAEIVAAQNAVALIKGDSDSTTASITASAAPFRQQILNDDQRPLVQVAIDSVNLVFSTLESDVLPLIAQTDFEG